MRNRILEKDKEHIESRLTEKRLTALESEVRKKDMQIKKLTKMVKSKPTKSLPGGPLRTQQVFAISHDPDADSDDSKESSDGSWGGRKMTRAEWLMAQVDLDPIESHGSMEMSTAKF